MYYKIVYYKEDFDEEDSNESKEFTEYFDEKKLKVVLDSLKLNSIEEYVVLNKNVKSCTEITQEEYERTLQHDNRKF